MITYQDLTDEERFEVLNKAFTYRHDFPDRIANAIKDTDFAVAPSDSDLFKPELWKGIHWNWFLKEYSK